MKKTLLFSIMLMGFLSFACAQEIRFENYRAGDYKNASTPEEKEGANISQVGRYPEEWSYGTIKQGSTGYRYFKFTNTGSSPLFITNATGSCGCTIPTYPKEPIMPGQTEYIKIKYDTNRMGYFDKYITITCNAKGNNNFRLVIRGDVESL